MDMSDPFLAPTLPRIPPAAVGPASAPLPSHTASQPAQPAQPPLTAASQHTFASYESLRAFLDSYARPRGFQIRWETKGSEHSATHGGKATCWCKPPPAADAEAAADGGTPSGGSRRKRRRRAVTCDGEQVFCGCRWHVNFNRRGDAQTAVYTITARNLQHNGDQHTQHNERPHPQPPASPAQQRPMDDAAALQARLAGAVEAGVRQVLSGRAGYVGVVGEEQLRRAVQLDKKRDGRLVCYAAKQCAAAINRQQQQQLQQASEQKDDRFMTDMSESPPATSAEEMAEVMAAAIRTQVASDEQLAAVADVSSAEGFINIALQSTLPPSATTSASPHPASIVAFPTFPLPTSLSANPAPPLPPSYLLPSIGTFHSIYNEKYGTPRQGSVTPHSRGQLVLHAHVDANCLVGLSDYSHVWLLFVFHLNTNTAVRAKVRPPRLGAKVGVFATRSPHRPAPIGMTVARLERVELDKRTVHVSGVDVVDGSPVLDIKPYHPADCVPTARVPQWVTDGSAASGLDVRVREHVREEMRRWAAEGRLDLYDDGDEALAAVVECISGDPRTLNAKKKHQHTYGTINTAQATAEHNHSTDHTHAQQHAHDAQADDAEGDQAAEAGAGLGDVIYGVSVDRVDVAFRMVYEMHEVGGGEEEGKDAVGADGEDEEHGERSGAKRRRMEVAEVFHCELFEAGQPRPKLRTKEWFARMRQVLAAQQPPQQQQQPAAINTGTTYEI